ncbi:MAG TPA: hypothetical protein VLF87_01295 [Patescibacteria group bacterium]|nr:hypothetical protein [Patescibacteria group bacterium]
MKHFERSLWYFAVGTALTGATVLGAAVELTPVPNVQPVCAEAPAFATPTTPEAETARVISISHVAETAMPTACVVIDVPEK